MSTLPEKAATGIRRRPIPDELGQGLLQALAAWRPQAVSLHDTTGEALWLSSGSIGPDEHSFVLAALDVFALEPKRECMHRKLEDGRRALFLAARDPMGACIGVSCAFIERGVIDDKSVVTPQIHTLLQRFSTLLAPHGDRTASQSALTLVREDGAGAARSTAGPPVRRSVRASTCACSPAAAYAVTKSRSPRWMRSTMPRFSSASPSG